MVHRLGDPETATQVPAETRIALVLIEQPQREDQQDARRLAPYEASP